MALMPTASSVLQQAPNAAASVVRTARRARPCRRALNRGGPAAARPPEALEPLDVFRGESSRAASGADPPRPHRSRAGPASRGIPFPARGGGSAGCRRPGAPRKLE